MSKFELRQFTGSEPLARAAAGDWLKAAAAVSPPAVFCAALSGGRIAKTFFAALAAQAAAPQLKSVHFFWSDERCVPPTDAESNYRPARELLFDVLAVGADQVHRIAGERPPEQAAAAAEAELRRVAAGTAGDQPVLDLVLLGMGEDGHVASLFPGEAEAALNSRAVFRPVQAVKPPPRRITLGYPALAAAREVWVLVSGPGKEAALRQSLKPDGRTPLARVVNSRPGTRIYSAGAI